MGKILYFLFLLPLSWLPLGILHLISYLLYFWLYYIIGYRKKIVLNNLSKSFPEMDSKLRKQIFKDYYLHFSDIIVEGIKNLSISEKELHKRYKVINPELVNEFYKKK